MKDDAEKQYDCMKMKRKAQAAIYEEIKEMLPQDEIEYFRESVKSSPFASWWTKLSQDSPQTRTTAS